MRLQVPLTSRICVILRKSTLLFPEFLLYFPEVPFFPWNCPFVFQKCPFIFQKCLFISRKMSYCFPELPFSMPKVTSILDSLKSSMQSMIFCAFYSNLASMIAWKTQFLSIQNFSGGATPKPLKEGGYSTPTRSRDCITHCLQQCKNKVPLN